jgi:hypothetical protein
MEVMRMSQRNENGPALLDRVATRIDEKLETLPTNNHAIIGGRIGPRVSALSDAYIIVSDLYDDLTDNAGVTPREYGCDAITY